MEAGGVDHELAGRIMHQTMLTEVVLRDQCQRTVPCVKRPGSRCSSIAYLQGQRVGKYIPWERMESRCVVLEMHLEHVGEGLTNRKGVIGHSAAWTR